MKCQRRDEKRWEKGTGEQQRQRTIGYSRLWIGIEGGGKGVWHLKSCRPNIRLQGAIQPGDT